MSGGETSGVDLARVALRAAMEAARKNGGQKAKRKPRAVTTVRRDRREPMGLGAAIGALVTERAWELPAAGATLRERWAAIAPELAGHVAAVSYDADSGRLTVCPESMPWATKAPPGADPDRRGRQRGGGPHRGARPADPAARRRARTRTGRCPGRPGFGRAHRPGQDPGDGV
ncbi:DciA family protein [Streptomyces diastaticus]